MHARLDPAPPLIIQDACTNFLNKVRTEPVEQVVDEPQIPKAWVGAPNAYNALASSSEPQDEPQIDDEPEGVIFLGSFLHLLSDGDVVHEDEDDAKEQDQNDVGNDKKGLVDDDDNWGPWIGAE